MKKMKKSDRKLGKVTTPESQHSVLRDNHAGPRREGTVLNLRRESRKKGGKVMSEH